MLFSADGLHLDYGNGPILDDERLDAMPGEKIGLVGANGAGKSSLLKILAGQEEASGRIVKTSGMKVHLLEQTPHFTAETVWTQMQDLNRRIDPPREEYELKAILTQLGFTDLETKISTLSGGQQRRLALAMALADRADLLLLDEPTNHLDIGMIEWLERWIARSKQTMLIVTHDRRFLDAVCSRILELERGHLYSYQGGYQAWLDEQVRRRELEESNARKTENLYRKELAWVRAGVQARSTKSKSRLDRFEQLRQQRQKLLDQSMELDFLSQRLGKKTLEWKNIAFGYPHEDLLFSGFSYVCKRTDRIGLIGANGSGKSTFLNLLAGELMPLEGEFDIGSTVKIGYYRQNFTLEDPSMRVLAYIEETAREVKTGQGMASASALLERFGFDKNRQYLPIERLSGGERRRLYLVKVLMEAPNVLLLDEPGNDLDIETLEILEDYLDTFPGVVITVSHDRSFLDRICTDLFLLDADHKWHHSIGGYTEAMMERAAAQEAGKEQARPNKILRPRRPSLSSKEKKALEEIPGQLEELETKKQALEAQMGMESDYTVVESLSAARDAIEEEIEALETQWMALEEKKEALAI